MRRAWTVGMVLVLSGCGSSQAARDVDPADQPDSGNSSFPDGPATHNIGYAALHLKGCVDVTVEHSVFDNVYKKGYGYGVAIMDYSDGITVRDSFFVTKGRHGITTGTANNSLPVAGYTKRVTVENNYFENFTDQAIDAHTETTGPYVARGNLVIDSRVGVNLRAGIGEISENVFIRGPCARALAPDVQLDGTPVTSAPAQGSRVRTQRRPISSLRRLGSTSDRFAARV